MKTFLTSFVALVLFCTSIPSTAATLSAAKTTTYNGETIFLFDLPEVEIKVEKATKKTELGPKTILEKESSNTLNDQDITINNEVITNCDLTIEISTFNYSFTENENAENIASEVNQIAVISAQNLKKEKPDLKKRPFLHFITNKVYHIGIEFLLKVNDGLFFRS